MAQRPKELEGKLLLVQKHLEIHVFCRGLHFLRALAHSVLGCMSGVAQREEDDAGNCLEAYKGLLCTAHSRVACFLAVKI